MATKDGGNEITEIGLFKDGLDHDIKMKERQLGALLDGLRRQIEGGIGDLQNGHRVPRGGLALQRGGEVDQLCMVLNEMYDLRISLNAALAHDEKNLDRGLHRGNETGGAK